VVLKHHSAFGTGTRDFAIGTNQIALCGGGQAGNQIEQGGFAAARVSDQGYKLDFGDREVTVTQRRTITFACFESLRNTLDFQELG
jgi:hypothetical protein